MSGADHEIDKNSNGQKITTSSNVEKVSNNYNFDKKNEWECPLNIKITRVDI